MYISAPWRAPLLVSAFLPWSREKWLSTPKSAGPVDDLLLIKDKFRTLRSSYKPPKYPIVLCHGLSGFDTLNLLSLPQVKRSSGDKDYDADLKSVSAEVGHGVMVNYWHGIREALTKAGAEVIIAKVPPFGTIEDRARSLDALLSEHFRKANENGQRTKINIVGHSMGGLDSRFLVSQVQNAESPYEVASVTTISTPHRGSEVADFIMDAIAEDSVLRASLPAAIPQLTTSYLKEFNERVPDDPSVSYFSYGASMHPTGVKLFRVTYEIIKRQILDRGGSRVENDGMVSIDSSIWGQYVGTLDDVDHLDLINWTNRVRATVDQVLFNQTPTFNPIALYLDIADTLSKKGF